MVKWRLWGCTTVLAITAGCAKPAPSTKEQPHTRNDGHAGMAMPSSTGDPDRDFLQAMIPHHQGAIDMARTELAKGSDPRVRAMAREVIATQQAEIDKMRGWLAEPSKAKKGS